MIETIWNYIWHSVWLSFGLAGVVVIICVIIAIYVPPLRKLAILVGGATLGAIAAYGKGVRDAKAREDARHAAAEDRSVATGEADRKRADSSAASGMPDGGNRD